MKNIFLILSILLLTIACSKEVPTNSNEQLEIVLPQKWELIKMSGSLANSETSGEDMSWQEQYILNKGQSFLKSRYQDGDTIEATGTFQYIELSGEMYLELTHAEANNIIGSCTGDLKELLLVTSDHTLSGTWSACDGPGLVYEKIQP